MSFPEIDCDRIVKTAEWKFFLITLMIDLRNYSAPNAGPHQKDHETNHFRD